MNIHKELWYIKSGSSKLAYMTYYEDNKAFEARKNTGTKWAEVSKQLFNYDTRAYEDNPKWKEIKGVITNNEPISGFKIGDCNSRWTTSNKVFEVRDPRGFTVEIPSGNLAALIQSCTIINGEVQGDCVWAREGSSHILLNVGSEPYKEALQSIETAVQAKEESKRVVSSLEKGDSYVSKTNQYNYLGRFKLIYKRQSGSSVEFISDNKFSNIFQTPYYLKESLLGRIHFDEKLDIGYERKSLHHYLTIDDVLGVSESSYMLPQRITNQGSEWEEGSSWSRRRGNNYCGTWTLVGYQEKGSKETVWATGYSKTDLEK